jgi:hypothetical protein
MNKAWLLIAILFITNIWADSLTLINDSTVRLRVVIQDVKHNFVDEIYIDAANSSTWSAEYLYYGYGAKSTYPKAPFTVTWYCMNGDVFGTCRFVNSDSTCNALSCGGPRECHPPGPGE